MASIQRLPLPGDVIAGKYRIDFELGTGGMGAVYHVTHRVTGKRFALKWLLPQASGQGDAAQRFIREAQVAGRFEHPNVVEVYDVGAEADSFYMVMELLEGESLAARVERAGPLSVADACRLLIPCMHGVAEAHAAGIIHRDLKPANIFVCAATRQSPEFAKVLDFGISKVSGTDDDVTSMTKSGTLIGTPHYMPLEQIRGRPVDHRVDVYAFGVVLYQVLSGKLPYPADSFSDLVLMVAHDTPKPLDQVVPKLPRGLAAIVARAMARNAEDRHPHLGAVIEDLEPYAVAGPMIQRMSPRPPSASLSIPTPLSTESQERRYSHRPASRSSAGVWIAGAVVALVLALGAGALWLKRNDLGALEALRPTDASPSPSAATTAVPGPDVDQRLKSPESQAPATGTESEKPPAEVPAPPATEPAPAPQPTAADHSEPGAAPPRDQLIPPAARHPEPLPPVPRPTARPRPAPSVVKLDPAPPPPDPPDPDPAEVQRPKPKGRVPAITEDDFY